MTTGTDPIGVARAMRCRIRAAATEIEQAQRVSADLVQTLRDAGLFSLLVPTAIGGGGVDPVTASRVVEDLAHADGSAGWVVMLAMQSGGFEASCPSRPHARSGGTTASSAAPHGRSAARSRRIRPRWASS